MNRKEEKVGNVIPLRVDPGAGLPRCLRVHEAALALRCSSKTIYRMVSDGRLPAYRVTGFERGGLLLIPEAEIAKLLERSRVRR
jgi:excisionase family DNA binding protein